MTTDLYTLETNAPFGSIDAIIREVLHDASSPISQGGRLGYEVTRSGEDLRVLSDELRQRGYRTILTRVRARA